MEVRTEEEVTLKMGSEGQQGLSPGSSVESGES